MNMQSNVPTGYQGKDIKVEHHESGMSIMPQSFAQVLEFSNLMAQSNAGIPTYLRGQPADCMAVTMQALKWGFDPFSVAQKSYKVKDVIAYEAQLIAAVVNTRSGIQGRLKYHFEGAGDELTCKVTGTIDGEELEYNSPPVGAIPIKNSPLWKGDPEQQLGYYSARAWARRHVPEVILGAYTREEAEEFLGPDNAKDVTPSPIANKYIANEGFGTANVDGEIEQLNSQDVADPPAASLQVEAGEPPSDETPSTLNVDSEGDNSEPKGSVGEGDTETKSTAPDGELPSLNSKQLERLNSYWRSMMRLIEEPQEGATAETIVEDIKKTTQVWKNSFEDLDVSEQARAVYAAAIDHLKFINNQDGGITRDDAVARIKEFAGIEVE